MTCRKFKTGYGLIVPSDKEGNFLGPDTLCFGLKTTTNKFPKVLELKALQVFLAVERHKQY